MHILDDYTPPSAADLARLKSDLGFTSEQMAALAGLAQGGQWRKYTGGSTPRTLGLQMHFCMAALLTLTDDELARVLSTMRAQGATVEAREVAVPEKLCPKPE